MSGHDNGRATDRGLSRRAFVKALGVGSAAAGGLVLGRPSFGQGT
ncbi:MAG: twin-arginine translocation signal domain-containing protein, partial [Acidobacteria bacterium]|nr:twin-arginine translocation signal domain-containing protein [Acidobacteriota bacterium]